MTDHRRLHTFRVATDGDPAELASVLREIADAGAVLHTVSGELEREARTTPDLARVTFECPQRQFRTIVAALRKQTVELVSADSESLSEELAAILVGPDVSDGAERVIENLEQLARTRSVPLAVFERTVSRGADQSQRPSARLRIATASETVEECLSLLRAAVSATRLRLIEPWSERAT